MSKYSPETAAVSWSSLYGSLEQWRNVNAGFLLEFYTCIYGLPSTTQYPTDAGPLFMVILIFGVCLPMILMFGAHATIFHAINRAHRQIAAQTHSIGGNATEQNSSLTSRSIRSGKNMLVVFLAHMILIIPVTVHAT